MSDSWKRCPDCNSLGVKLLKPKIDFQIMSASSSSVMMVDDGGAILGEGICLMRCNRFADFYLRVTKQSSGSAIRKDAQLAYFLSNLDSLSLSPRIFRPVLPLKGLFPVITAFPFVGRIREIDKSNASK